jgi:hypothetical protein
MERETVPESLTERRPQPGMTKPSQSTAMPSEAARRIGLAAA